MVHLAYSRACCRHPQGLITQTDIDAVTADDVTYDMGAERPEAAYELGNVGAAHGGEADYAVSSAAGAAAAEAVYDMGTGGALVDPTYDMGGGGALVDPTYDMGTASRAAPEAVYDMGSTGADPTYELGTVGGGKDLSRNVGMNRRDSFQEDVYSKYEDHL